MVTSTSTPASMLMMICLTTSVGALRLGMGVSRLFSFLMLIPKCSILRGYSKVYLTVYQRRGLRKYNPEASSPIALPSSSSSLSLSFHSPLSEKRKWGSEHSLNQSLVNSHLIHIPRLRTLTTRSFSRRDL